MSKALLSRTSLPPPSSNRRFSKRRKNINGSRTLCLCCLAVVIVTCQVTCVGAGSRMIEPPSRASLWRYGFGTPVNFQDDEIMCGGYEIQYGRNDGKCGVCGDPWDDIPPRQNEAGHVNNPDPRPVRVYYKGGYIAVAIESTKDLLGQYEFRLCEVAVNNVTPDQECFDRTRLAIKESQLGQSYRIGQSGGLVILHLDLPDDLVCQHCILQWRHVTGNRINKENCIRCAGDAQPTCNSCRGCGQQVWYQGCADIAIYDVLGSHPAVQGVRSQQELKEQWEKTLRDMQQNCGASDAPPTKDSANAINSSYPSPELSTSHFSSSHFSTTSSPSPPPSSSTSSSSSSSTSTLLPASGNATANPSQSSTDSSQAGSSGTGAMSGGSGVPPAVDPPGNRPSTTAVSVIGSHSETTTVQNRVEGGAGGEGGRTSSEPSSGTGAMSGGSGVPPPVDPPGNRPSTTAVSVIGSHSETTTVQNRVEGGEGGAVGGGGKTSSEPSGNPTTALTTSAKGLTTAVRPGAGASTASAAPVITTGQSGGAGKATSNGAATGLAGDTPTRPPRSTTTPPMALPDHLVVTTLQSVPSTPSSVSRPTRATAVSTSKPTTPSAAAKPNRPATGEPGGANPGDFFPHVTLSTKPGVYRPTEPPRSHLRPANADNGINGDSPRLNPDWMGVFDSAGARPTPRPSGPFLHRPVWRPPQLQPVRVCYVAFRPPWYVFNAAQWCVRNCPGNGFACNYQTCRPVTCPKPVPRRSRSRSNYRLSLLSLLLMNEAFEL